MRHAVIAVVQQGLRLYPHLDAYRRDLERFFRLAEMKHARLMVFPERTALMVIPPLVEGFRSGLLKKADLSRGRVSSWWERTRAGVMRSTAKLLRADIARELHRALEENPGFIWQKYVEIFAALAYEYKVTVVAGSGFFPDVNSGTLRHVATVFGPDGDIIGQQAKVVLDDEERSVVEAGSGWQFIPTPVGRLGIVFGEEVMYPEVGRVLAYQGVEGLIVLAATRDETVVRQLHDGLKARVTDNQIFGAIAFTVGEDPFSPEERPPFRGRSIIMAPHGLTPRGNGVLVESGSSSAEVLVTARWDFEALHRYWESAPIPVRGRLPTERTAPLLVTLYNQGLTLEEAVRALPSSGPRALPQREPVSEATEEPESAAVSSVTEVPAEEEGAPAEAPLGEGEAAREAEAAAAEEAKPAAEQGEEIPPAARPEVVPPAEGEVAAEIAVEEEAAPVKAESPAVAAEADVQVEEVAERGPEDTAARVEVVTSPEDRVVAEGFPPTEPTVAMPSAQEETEAEEVTVEAADESEGMGSPDELWATIKAELKRAAITLRSLREPTPEEASSARPESPAASEEASSKRSGWFHNLMAQTRGRAREEEFDEF